MEKITDHPCRLFFLYNKKPIDIEWRPGKGCIGNSGSPEFPEIWFQLQLKGSDYDVSKLQK